MSELNGDDSEERVDDVVDRPGEIADSQRIIESCFSPELRRKYEFFSYRNAAVILKHGFPEHCREIERALLDFGIDTAMVRMPGGNKGPIPKRLERLFSAEWKETRIVADLAVSLYPAGGGRARPLRDVAPLDAYTREGYFDGHRIDLLRGKVAIDIEWNSKDQTYDRDLYALGAFYEAGAIAVGVIVTRGFDLDEGFFRSLGPVLRKDGSIGPEATAKKFGASTTWMGKLLYRLEAGRNGGCPVLAVGIKRTCVSDYPH
jgi:hypothetical protein